MAMQWPTRDDYLSAIQNPQNCFDDPELKSGVTAKDKFGLPFPSSGQFAVVFQLFVHTRSFGVRFFTSPVTDQQERYGKLGQHFAGFSHPALVRFSYLSQGIRVRGQKYPLVRMEWIPGEQLHSFVGARLARPTEIGQLAAQWRGVIAGLQGAHSAHGDLQHGNVLVDSSGQIRLVDYDAFFIPSLSGRPPGEVGHRNYQHPERIEYGQYDENTDNFSALVIYLSLLALTFDPGLWTFHDGDNLIFRADDFKQPGQTHIWKRLTSIQKPEIQRLTRELIDSCRAPLDDVPDLESVLQGLPRRPRITKTTQIAIDNPKLPLVQRLEEIRSHIAVALADDGVLSPKEEKHIRERGQQLQISFDDIEKIIREEVRKSAVQSAPAGARNLPAGRPKPAPTAHSAPGGVRNTPASRSKPAATISTPLPAATAGPVVASTVVASTGPKGIAFADYRRNLFWWGALVGSAIGLVLYSILPDGSNRMYVTLIAGSVAVIAAVVVGAQMGRWGGGIAGFFLAGIAADVLKAMGLLPYSVGAWATIFAAFLYTCARPLFAGTHTGKRRPMFGVALGAFALFAVILLGGIASTGEISSFLDRFGRATNPGEGLLASNNAAVFVDELSNASLGNTYGIAWTSGLGNHGAVFSAANASRIEYPGKIPREGTIEFWIKVDSGYAYSDYVFKQNLDNALIFSTDALGGDVTWPGTTKFSVSRNGNVSLFVAENKYNNPPTTPIEVRRTRFRFGEWHGVGFSVGSLGQFIMVDGKVIAADRSRTQQMGSAGTHESPADIPTLGETVSHFWPRHRYEGGFEGIVARFRASPKQRDWYLATDIRGSSEGLRIKLKSIEIVPMNSKPSTLSALETGVFATCAEVRGWRDFSKKNDFRAGEAFCFYVEALNVNQGGRVDVSYSTKIQSMNGAIIAQQRDRESSVTPDPNSWHKTMLSLPQSLSPGTYIAVVDMRNNITGQAGSASKNFTVLPSASNTLVHVVPSGTQISVRLADTLDSEEANSLFSHRFRGVVEEAVFVDGQQIIPKGAEIHLEVKGFRLASLGGRLLMVLHDITLDNTPHPVSTEFFQQDAPESGKAAHLDPGAVITFKLNQSLVVQD